MVWQWLWNKVEISLYNVYLFLLTRILSLQDVFRSGFSFVMTKVTVIMITACFCIDNHWSLFNSLDMITWTFSSFPDEGCRLAVESSINFIILVRERLFHWSIWTILSLITSITVLNRTGIRSVEANVATTATTMVITARQYWWLLVGIHQFQ